MNKTAVHAIIMVLTTILAKVLGFCRELSLAFSYGASNVSDAYVVAFTLPTILFSGLGTAMLTSYISVYTDLQQNRPGEEKPFHDQVITMSFLLSVGFIAVFLALRYPIVRLFALGFEGAQLDLTVNLSSIMIASLVFLGVGYILQGYLQMKGCFFTVGMVSVPLNIAVIATILLSGENYDMLGWGVVIGYAGEFLLVLLVALRRQFCYHPDIAFRNHNIRKFLVMVLPIFLGKTINSINIIIDKSIASLLSEGVVSVLNYGNRITGFVTSVFVVSITTALFPQLSRLSAASDTRQLKHTYRSSCGIIGLFVIPISAGMMMFSKEFVQLLFFRGEFTEFDVQRTGEVVFFYSLGLLFYSIKEVTINVYYALQDTKTPTINSLLAIVLNIVINLLLMRTMEHKGLGAGDGAFQLYYHRAADYSAAAQDGAYGLPVPGGDLPEDDNSGRGHDRGDAAFLPLVFYQDDLAAGEPAGSDRSGDDRLLYRLPAAAGEGAGPCGGGHCGAFPPETPGIRQNFILPKRREHRWPGRSW